MLFFLVRDQELRNAQLRCERQGQLYIAAVRQGVGSAIDALQTINHFFVTNGEVGREQFQVFTQPLLQRYPYVEAFGFQRVVERDQRAAFEARMRSRDPHFAIADMVAGRRTVAGTKERYRVIEYVAPMQGNEMLIGMDTSAQRYLDDAVRRATDTGLPAATGLVRIFKDGDRQRSLRILMALYRHGAAPASVAARRQAVVGYTGMVLRTGDLFAKILGAMGSASNTGLNIRIYAAPFADEAKLSFAQSGSNGGDGGKVWPWLQRPISFVENFDLAGASWHIVVAPAPTPFFALHASALLVFLVACLLTCAAAAYVQAVLSSRQKINLLVAKRTDELALRTVQLKHVNDLLIKDIERRNRVERALLASEERARERAELSSDWYWELDERFRFARRSGMTIGRFGLPYWVTLGARPWELPVDLHASDWPAQRAALEAHQPFRNFEMRVLVEGHGVQWCSISGQPLFDAAGVFTGYHGTGRNISARKLAEEELLHSRSMLRQLADHQETVREDERKRIARDIHDDLGQNLLVLKIDVATLHARTGERHPKLNQRVALVLENINAAVKSLKSIMNDLRPAALDHGLHCAVEWQLRQFERMSGIACTLEAPDPPDFDLNEARTLAVFRILQESLSNVLRHAEASEVRVALACDARGFTMRIRDNGKGMEMGSGRKADSFGLIGIKERSYALGGELTLESGPGRGTLLRLFIPARS